MTELTDFADPAVVLPVVVVIALALGLLGWWHGALVWLAAVGLSFGAVLMLKLGFAACGTFPWTPALRSPSGHTAAAAVLAGGIAVMLGWNKWRALALAILGAAAIGATRLALGQHTLAEAMAGGAIGVAGALGVAWLAGPPPPLRFRWLLPVIAAMALLLHGHHLDVQSHIRPAGRVLRSLCVGDHAR